MQINSVQGLNAYTTIQGRQDNTQNTPPAQPQETQQSIPVQDSAVVEISPEATAQLAAEETTAVQPPPSQTPDQSQPPAQPEQPTPVIDIVA